MTYLEIVNNVLTRLRMDRVSSVFADNYSRLIGVFVNDAKREVEDAWDWNSLRQSVIIDTKPGYYAYQMKGVGMRAKLMYNTRGEASVLNLDTGINLRGPMPSDFMTYRLSQIREQQEPMFFDINGTLYDDPVINFWPIPDKCQHIQVDMIVPGPDLVNNSDEPEVPYWPIVLGAYAKAISERGEDGGMSFDEAMALYNQALADSIQLDARNQPYKLTSTVI